MAENDREFGESVKQSAGHQSQCVSGSFDGEGPRRAEQFGMALVEALRLAEGTYSKRAVFFGPVRKLRLERDRIDGP